MSKKGKKRRNSDFRIDLEKYYLISYKTISPRLRDKIKLWLLNMGFHCTAIYRLGRLAEQIYAEKNKRSEEHTSELQSH